MIPTKYGEKEWELCLSITIHLLFSLDFDRRLQATVYTYVHTIQHLKSYKAIFCKIRIFFWSSGLEAHDILPTHCSRPLATCSAKQFTILRYTMMASPVGCFTSCSKLFAIKLPVCFRLSFNSNLRCTCSAKVHLTSTCMSISKWCQVLMHGSSAYLRIQ